MYSIVAIVSEEPPKPSRTPPVPLSTVLFPRIEKYPLMLSLSPFWLALAVFLLSLISDRIAASMRLITSANLR